MVCAGLESGCIVVEIALRLRNAGGVRPWASQGRVALRVASLQREANGLSPAPVGSRAQIELSKAVASTRARQMRRVGGRMLQRLENGYCVVVGWLEDGSV